MYVGERMAGVVRSPNEFATAFFCQPTPFYMVIRMLAALAVSLVPVVLYRIGRSRYSRRVGLLCSLFFILGPPLFDYGRDATPYGPLLTLLVLAFFWLLRISEQGSLRNYALGGFFVGLATSTHYLAALAVVPIVLLHFKSRRRFSLLVGSGTAALIAFFVSSPYLFLDFRSAWFSTAGLYDIHVSSAPHTFLSIRKFFEISRMLATFMDPYGIGAIFVLIAFWRSPPGDRINFLIWLSPLVVMLPALAASQFGAQIRYAFVIIFPLFVLAAIGADKLWTMPWVGDKAVYLLTPILLILFVMDLSLFHDRALVDTRTAAEQWIKQNIPSERSILLTDPFACPQLPMSKNQAHRMRERLQREGHPRAKYYQALENCPFPGYEIKYQKLSNHYVSDTPARTEKSYRGMETIDISQVGLENVGKCGIDYLVVNDKVINYYGWREQLPRLYVREALFTPVPGRIRGSVIEIYRTR
jgi:hypothetical protein